MLEREFARANKSGSFSAAAVGDLAKSLMEVILEADTPVATLLALRDRDDFALVHSVNVATLAGSQAGSLGLNDVDVQKIVSASLTHDIGKTKVPESVLTKGSPLSAPEQAMLARHTVEGARILFETPGTDPLAAIVAMRHHSVVEPGAPGLCAVELCKLADVFDMIRSLRPFDDAAMMRGAVAFMVRRMRNRFNPYLLERFGAMVELAPEGTPVALSSGEIAEVVQVHSELSLHPVVHIKDSRRGHRPAGTTVNLAEESAVIAVPAVPPVFRDLDPADIDALG
ncbi:MAG: HD domain-containing protein [Myxococcota bacterium]